MNSFLPRMKGRVSDGSGHPQTDVEYRGVALGSFHRGEEQFFTVAPEIESPSFMILRPVLPL
jgi:hypothetical protein